MSKSEALEEATLIESQEVPTWNWVNKLNAWSEKNRQDAERINQETERRRKEREAQGIYNFWDAFKAGIQRGKEINANKSRKQKIIERTGVILVAIFLIVVGVLYLVI